VPDTSMESDSLSGTVEFFLIAVFLGVHFYIQTPSTYQTT
jgi:hypothetical protein